MMSKSVSIPVNKLDGKYLIETTVRPRERTDSGIGMDLSHTDDSPQGDKLIEDKDEHLDHHDTQFYLEDYLESSEPDTIPSDRYSRSSTTSTSTGCVLQTHPEEYDYDCDSNHEDMTDLEDLPIHSTSPMTMPLRRHSIAASSKVSAIKELICMDNSPVFNLMVERHRSDSFGGLVERGLKAMAVRVSMSNSPVNDLKRIQTQPNLTPECPLVRPRRAHSVPVILATALIEKDIGRKLGQIGDSLSREFLNRH